MRPARLSVPALAALLTVCLASVAAGVHVALWMNAQHRALAAHAEAVLP